VPHLSRCVTGGAFESGPFVDGANALVYHGEDRATTANCGSIWSQTFSFDAFGNINKTGNSSFSASYSPSTNRMTTIGSSTPTYDANGNVTNDFLHTYAWDAEGRPVTIDGIGATYDALGRMVELNRSGTYTEIAYSPSGGKLALMSGQSLLRAFVPLPGGATAVYTSSGLDHYRHSDWLGSARLETTPSQTVYGDAAYAPYGETYAQSGTADFSWTGINADVEPANPETLYDFPAREYGIQGRWPSPDPLGLGAANLGDPQSWNRYAYVDNNPLAVTDPSGNGPEIGPLCVVQPEACIIIGIFEGIFAFFFGHHHHPAPPPPPQAPPAPQGGYGAGIDPFGNSFLPGEISGIPVGLVCMFQPCDWAGSSWYDHTNLNRHWNVKPQQELPKMSQQDINACQTNFLSTTYGAGTPEFASHFSLLNLFSKQGGTTTGIVWGIKLAVGTAVKLAGATTGEVTGAFAIPGGLGTLYDVQAKSVCGF
jgi:RHS repeat-associated protein